MLCAARLEPYKGVDILLDAVPPQARLLIAGDGSQRAVLESRSLPNVEFAGAVDPSQMPALFARAEIVVLPSRTEGLPVALLLLVGFEALLLSVFLPARWQFFSDHSSQEYKDSLTTHPNLDQEIQQVWNQHPRIRIAVIAIYGLVLSGNTLVLVKTWKALRSARQPLFPTI